jgi:hypothetical protein
MCKLRGASFAILGFMCAISQYWRLLWKTKRLMSGQKSQYLLHLPLPSLFPFETSKYMFFQRLIIPQGAQMVTSMYCLVCTLCFWIMPPLLMLQEPVLVICQLEGTLQWGIKMLCYTSDFSFCKLFNIDSIWPQCRITIQYCAARLGDNTSMTILQMMFHVMIIVNVLLMMQ